MRLRHRASLLGVLLGACVVTSVIVLANLPGKTSPDYTSEAIACDSCDARKQGLARLREARSGAGTENK